MPLYGLRWSRNSGSANCDMPQSAVFGRPGEGAEMIGWNHRQSNLSWYIWTAFRYQPPPNLPRMITHPNLPHGKGQAITKPNCFQPPPSLPRRGGTVTIAIDKRLIIRQLQMIIRQYSTANGICPSPSGEARWGLKSVSRVTSSFSWGRLGWVWG